MFWAEFLFIVAIALLLTALFAGGLRRAGPWEGWWWFFLVVLLGGWVAALWAEPVGPPMWGVAWLPILWLALLFALLLAAAAPPRPPAGTPPPRSEDEAAAATAMVALSGFFWVLVIGMAIAILVGYLR
jgi:hypothetical protein